MTQNQKADFLLRRIEEQKFELFLAEHVLRNSDYYRNPQENGDVMDDGWRRYLKDNPDKVLMWGAVAIAFLLGYALG